MRDLVDRIKSDLIYGRITKVMAAHRMYWSGVPISVALRVVAGR